MAAGLVGMPSSAEPSGDAARRATLASRSLLSAAVALLMGGAVAADAGTPDASWQVRMAGKAGEASVTSAAGTRLAVRCDPGAAPTVTVAYLGPPGVRLPVTRYGVNRWNIMFSFSGAAGDEGGSIHDFAEQETADGRALYRLSVAGDAPAMEDMLLLVNPLRASQRVEVASTETDAAGQAAPQFRDPFTLAGADAAIRRALGPGGCLDLLDEVQRRFDEGL